LGELREFYEMYPKMEIACVLQIAVIDPLYNIYFSDYNLIPTVILFCQRPLATAATTSKEGGGKA
jgi:hypothetical protein